MNDTIKCPKCGEVIEVTEVMTAQLSSKIRDELEGQYKARQREQDKKQRELDKMRETLEEAKETVDEQVKARLKEEKSKLRSTLHKEVQEELNAELADRDEQLKETRQKLKEAQEQELEVRKLKREVEQQAEQQKLELQRKLDAERAKIREEASKQADEESQLKMAQKDKKITDLAAQLAEMKRKMEQGSQQAQGEVQELALEEMLNEAYPADSIEEVPKGIRGADVIQRVLSAGGMDCGTIIWESKRTKNWTDGWLAKLRDDQRQAKATVAVIVSEALPPEVTHFNLIDGVWVCSWTCARSLAAALRVALLNVANARQVETGRQEKAEVVYGYLTSPEFKHRVTGMAEALIEMQRDLDREKRAIQGTWAKREKQIERAVIGVAGMYGDLRGVIGTTLPAIDGLDLPQLEAPAQPAAE